MRAFSVGAHTLGIWLVGWLVGELVRMSVRAASCSPLCTRSVLSHPTSACSVFIYLVIKHREQSFFSFPTVTLFLHHPHHLCLSIWLVPYMYIKCSLLLRIVDIQEQVEEE